MSKRKQSKLLEIEKGLEEKRTEERLGLAFILIHHLTKKIKKIVYKTQF